MRAAASLVGSRHYWGTLNWQNAAIQRRRSAVLRNTNSLRDGAVDALLDDIGIAKRLHRDVITDLAHQHAGTLCAAAQQQLSPVAREPSAAPWPGPPLDAVAPGDAFTSEKTRICKPKGSGPGPVEYDMQTPL